MICAAYNIYLTQSLYFDDLRSCGKVALPADDDLPPLMDVEAGSRGAAGEALTLKGIPGLVAGGA